ncbi:MAG: PfkB family carbohydrate kinase [Candidatus Micrarchaeia archaeon]
MKGTKLLALGTPVMDIFYEADYAFLKKHNLEAGCTNHLTDEQVAQIEKELAPIHEAAGDNARNVCESYAKSGGRECAYMGNVAKDETAKKIRSNLKKNKIGDLTANVDGKSGRIMCIITPDKQRTFAVYLGVGEKKVDISSLGIADVFFCTSITLFHPGVGESAYEFAKKCKENGGKVAVSLESQNLLRENLDKMSMVIEIANYLFLNEDEMKAIGYDEKNVGKLAKIVFLKKGADGSRVYKNGKVLGDAPAIKVGKVVDTTGAGDFYAGAALYALSTGLDEMRAAKAANEMAAKIISKIGAGL